MVELVLRQAEAADQRAHRAVLRIERHQRGLDGRQLVDRRVPGRVGGDPDDRAGPQPRRDERPRPGSRPREIEPVPGNDDFAPVPRLRDHPALAGGQHDGRDEPGNGGARAERGGRAGRSGRRVSFRARVRVAMTVIGDAGLHGRVRAALLRGAHRRPHLEAALVGGFAIAVDHHLANHLADVVGMHRLVARRRAGVGRGAQRGLIVRVVEVVQIVHPAEDQQLPAARALGMADRIVGGRRLRQSGEQRGLRGRHVREVDAEVGLRGGAEAVRALAEIDLVQVELQDLLLGELRFDADRQQDLVDLAHDGLVARQEEIACELHRDRARALFLAAPREIGERRAREPDEVDAVMVVEARILGGEHRVLHHGGNPVERQRNAPLDPVPRDQHVVGGVDAQRHGRLERRQDVDRRQLRVEDDDDVAEQQRARHRDRQAEARAPEQQRAQPPRRSGRRVRSLAALGS